MKLLTEELRRLLPMPSAETGDDPTIYAKFFTPDAGWTWYVASGEPDGDDFVFFGYVVGVCGEWGGFRLSELMEVRGKLGLPVERDRHFTAGRFCEVVPEWHREA